MGTLQKPETDGEAAVQSVETRLPNRGGARRDRTADLLHAMQALSQLSYGPTAGKRGSLAGGVSQRQANASASPRYS
jgi:hypothetical protein